MPQTKTAFETVKDFYRGSTDGLPTFNRNSAKESFAFLNAVHGLLRDHALLIEAHDALAAQIHGGSKVTALSAPVDDTPGNGHGLRFTVPDLDYIWKYVKAKAEKDSAAILEVLTRRPELRIKIERQTIQMDDSQLIGRIARLLHEGWFAQPKNGPAVQKELKRRGCEQPTTNLYKPLNKLTEMGFLTLESDGYREVAEMKALVQKA